MALPREGKQLRGALLSPSSRGAGFEQDRDGGIFGNAREGQGRERGASSRPERAQRAGPHVCGCCAQLWARGSDGTSGKRLLPSALNACVRTWFAGGF